MSPMVGPHRRHRRHGSRGDERERGGGFRGLPRRGADEAGAGHLDDKRLQRHQHSAPRRWRLVDHAVADSLHLHFQLLLSFHRCRENHAALSLWAGARQAGDSSDYGCLLPTGVRRKDDSYGSRLVAQCGASYNGCRNKAGSMPEPGTRRRRGRILLDGSLGLWFQIWGKKYEIGGREDVHQ